MQLNRRSFFKVIGAAGASSAVLTSKTDAAWTSKAPRIRSVAWLI